jgi:protoheme IX farnesyltransferase
MKAVAIAARNAMVSEYLKLTKPRITTMVVLTTLVGFYLGATEPIRFVLLFHALLGTALVASGASALNMVLEWEADAKMRRTENRPIPSGKLTVPQALFFGAATSVVGILYLWIFVNLLTSILSMVTSGLYLFAYTPLKKKTSLCTIVGAIPGAIPPMMGWSAVRNSLDFHAWWLFAILFLWQLPHFLSIAWIYREDYARGGFPMLPVEDPDGVRTSRHIVLQTLVLLVITMIPAYLGLFHAPYFWGALLLGAFFLTMGFRLARTKSKVSARALLLTSVIYLPSLLGLMMIAKV